jgi:hypothetical protein
MSRDWLACEPIVVGPVSEGMAGPLLSLL